MVSTKLMVLSNVKLGEHTTDGLLCFLAVDDAFMVVG